MWEGCERYIYVYAIILSRLPLKGGTLKCNNICSQLTSLQGSLYFQPPVELSSVAHKVGRMGCQE